MFKKRILQHFFCVESVFSFYSSFCSSHLMKSIRDDELFVSDNKCIIIINWWWWGTRNISEFLKHSHGVSYRIWLSAQSYICKLVTSVCINTICYDNRNIISLTLATIVYQMLSDCYHMITSFIYQCNKISDFINFIS